MQNVIIHGGKERVYYSEPYTQAEHDAIFNQNLPDADRIAMRCAFALFRAIHGGAVSPDSSSPYGMSWHNFYKSTCLEALRPFMNKRGKIRG